MVISILTLFPEMFRGPFSQSIVKRAVNKKLATIKYINIRDFSPDKYKTVDDRPYGGGAGMIMRVDVLDRAISKAKAQMILSKTILLDPRGKTYTQKKALELSKLDQLILVCGHYEGVDERIRKLVDEQISIGDYILTGGEIPAMVVVDSIVRLIPGVLKNPDATRYESFSPALGTSHFPPCSVLEYPQYTRPQNYKNLKVPQVLLSGNHLKIEKWRQKHALMVNK